ncbi:MAG: class I SAM-dependent methyltransferase [Candidatus Falkowbacteria bacterium]|nr:class I SAM-dependent methyltransferase [Candidatus Falkowbacteria bacterium]
MKDKHQFSMVRKSYLRIANKINYLLARDNFSKDIKILDWGGNDGVLATILYDLNYRDITVFDVGAPLKFDLERFPNLRNVSSRWSEDLIALPFADQSFDVLVSCGVLEHAAFINRSLEEINRVLKYDGRFFIFHFPQQRSWTEFIASIHKKSGHSRKYSARELRIFLNSNGFEVKKLWKFNFLPKALYPLPEKYLKYYSKISRPVFWLDGILSRVPLINLFCNSLECYCVKVKYIK